MLVFQIIVVLFSLFVIGLTISRFKEGEIKRGEFIGWTIFWVIVIVVVLIPRIASSIAKALGIGRAVDVVIYVAIIILFYLIFRIYTKIDKINQDLTKIVRKVALIKKGK